MCFRVGGNSKQGVPGGYLVSKKLFRYVKTLTSITSIEFNVNVLQFHSKHEIVMKTLRVEYFS